MSGRGRGIGGDADEHAAAASESRPALAGGAGDDLELDPQEWAAVYPRQISAEQWQPGAETEQRADAPPGRAEGSPAAVQPGQVRTA